MKRGQEEVVNWLQRELERELHPPIHPPPPPLPSTPFSDADANAISSIMHLAAYCDADDKRDHHEEDSLKIFWFQVIRIVTMTKTFLCKHQCHDSGPNNECLGEYEYDYDQFEGIIMMRIEDLLIQASVPRQWTQWRSVEPHLTLKGVTKI